MSAARVATGLDRLVVDGFSSLRDRRVGVICNPTSVDVRLRHIADLLDVAPHVQLKAVFGPEHGVRAEAQDMIGVRSSIDRRTGVPVFSLYGADEASLSPTPVQLDGLDVLVFDVQDVGSRYYTFAATMLYAMRVASGSGVRFVVLDRPNPIGGVAVEGPSIEPGYHSFVGAFPLPIRHGMSVGELARLFQAEERLDLELDVIACEGLTRAMYWDDTGLPWVLPSPNMPTPDTAFVYPGGCLIEGTNLSEGRGTTQPFALWGAPWIDPYRLAESCEDAPGVILRPCSFRPTFHKHAATICQGVQPHVTDRNAFQPVRLYARLIAESRRQAPELFAWRTEPYEFVQHPIAIDLLFGSSRERLAIEGGVSVNDLFADWRTAESEFSERRRPYLLYP